MTRGLRAQVTGAPGGGGRVLAAAFLLVAGISALAVAGTPASGSPVVPADAFVNITATSSLTFVPSQFTVVPGAAVHLIVTQGSTFTHTFTLSPLANYTIPTTDSPTQLYAFFQAHPPLVNLTLGPTAGVRYYANFTAPPAGTYEFVCEQHFPGMKGTMTSSTPASSTGSGSPSSLPLPLVGAVAGAGAIVLATVALVVTRRRRLRREDGDRPMGP